MTTDLESRTALLALEDGTVFWEKSVGSAGETFGEMVFNTGMTGYQEILTNPSYQDQIVVMTYPGKGVPSVRRRLYHIPYITALVSLRATVAAIRSLHSGSLPVRELSSVSGNRQV